MNLKRDLFSWKCLFSLSFNFFFFFLFLCSALHIIIWFQYQYKVKLCFWNSKWKWNINQRYIFTQNRNMQSIDNSVIVMENFWKKKINSILCSFALNTWFYLDENHPSMRWFREFQIFYSVARTIFLYKQKLFKLQSEYLFSIGLQKNQLKTRTHQKKIKCWWKAHKRHWPQSIRVFCVKIKIDL